MDTFILPETYTIGERRDYRKHNDKQSLVHVPVCVQFIPIRKVLQKFFELPDVLDKTIQYVQSLLENSKFITNIIQGTLLKNTVFLEPNRITLPLLIYFDDYENNNHLGLHKGINKCGAVYVAIPCLHLIFQSKVENIFLFLLFNTLDRQIFSNKITFARASNQLIK